VEEGEAFPTLLRYALQAGLGVLEFWDLTPAETYAAIEASIWRITQSQRRELAQAWRIAAFSRAKRLPPLNQVLNTGPAKPLKGAERLKRRKEFADMQAAIDPTKLKLTRKAE